MSDVYLLLFDVQASKSSDDIKLRLCLRNRQSLQMSSVSQKYTYTKAKQTSVNYNWKRLNKYVDGQKIINNDLAFFQQQSSIKASDHVANFTVV